MSLSDFSMGAVSGQKELVSFCHGIKRKARSGAMGAEQGGSRVGCMRAYIFSLALQQFLAGQITLCSDQAKIFAMTSKERQDQELFGRANHSMQRLSQFFAMKSKERQDQELFGRSNHSME